MRKRKSDSSDLGVLLLDVKQVAELLNIGVSTVWALVKVGRFPEPIRLTTRCSRWRRVDSNDPNKSKGYILLRSN